MITFDNLSILHLIDVVVVLYCEA